MRLSILFLSLSFCNACNSLNATSMRVGHLQHEREKNCFIQFENLTFQEASAKYMQIGMVTLTGTSDEPLFWKGITKEMLSPKVCEMGGEIVTPNTFTTGQRVMGLGTGSIQFSVWVKKSSRK